MQACDPLNLQESFKRFVGALITRRNHWNDLYYRDDPTILAWELANEPHMPGDDTGIVLKVRIGRVCDLPKPPVDKDHSGHSAAIG